MLCDTGQTNRKDKKMSYSKTDDNTATEVISKKIEHNKAILESEHVWEINDRFSHVKALPIKTPLGDRTDFAMVYSKNPDDGIWTPTRPVSIDRYQPISTAMIVDAIRDRFNDEATTINEKVRYGTRTTKQEISLILDLHTVKINGKPRDAGTIFTELGEKTNNEDLWRPTIRVRNAYDGTNAASVYAGWYRMICSNGLIVPAWEGSTFKAQNIHTVHQIEHLVNSIGKMTFNVTKFRKAMTKMIKTPLSDKEIEELQKLLPKNHREKFLEAPHSNTYEVLSFLTYLQSHEMSLARGRVVQPIINDLMNNAA